jgi:hypothetical protein
MLPVCGVAVVTLSEYEVVIAAPSWLMAAARYRTDAPESGRAGMA